MLRCTIYTGGQNIECNARPEDFVLPLGFYDEDNKPIPDPFPDDDDAPGNLLESG